jgi:hypothetical protein
MTSRALYAACVVLFPALFIVFAGTATGVHPDPSGETAVDQVRAVASSAAAWRLVHLVLAGASLLGIGAVLALRSLVPRRGRLDAAASAVTALGILGGGMTAGILAMEAGMVAPVAEACAGSGACLTPANEPFLGEFADVSWNSIPYLSYTAGSLVFALAVLAALGWRARSVRAWEAALIVVGVVGVYATNTILHGDAWYGLVFVLVAGASIAARMLRAGVAAAPA